MKKLLLAAAVTLSLSAVAHADPSAVLKLTGVLTNDACEPELADGGVVDFGTKYVDGLSATETNQLGSKDTSLTVTCFAPTKVSWSIADDRVDSQVKLTLPDATFSGDDSWGSTTQFGVGLTADGIKIGSYAVAIDVDHSTADGSIMRVGYYGTADADEPGEVETIGEFTTGLLTNNGNNSFSMIDSSNAPIAVTTAVFPLRITLAVQDTTTLAITDNTQIDGQATITLHYL